MPTLNTPHGTLHYVDAGSGASGNSDVPIVLVHGFPLDGRVWEDVAAILARSRRVIVPDLPGFGKSTASGAFTMETLADALVALLDHLKVDRAAFAGLSMGGYVIQALVRRAPARVERLILVDTRANADDDDARAARDRMIQLVREQGTGGVVQQMLPKMLHPDAYARRPELVERQRSIMMECPPQTIEYACAAMRDRADFTVALSTLPCRLQIIVGDADAIAPPEVSRSIYAAAGPRARLDVVGGAGHMAPLEKPDEVARVLA